MPAQAGSPPARAYDPARADQGAGDYAASVIADTLVIGRGVSAGDSWATVDAEKIKEALGSLKDGGYRLLVFLTCVDHLAATSRAWPRRYELAYQLRNYQTKDPPRVPAFADADPPPIHPLHH